MKENWQLRGQELRRTIRIILSTPAGIVGAVIVVLLLACVVFAPFLAPHDPYLVSIENKLRPPSSEQWLGTDTVGRDVLSRIIYGSRYSLASGTIVVGIGIIVGSIVGLLAAYPGGRWGELIMRFTDIFLAFPTMLLAIALASTLGPSFLNSMIAISIVYWPKYARLVYGQALSIRERDYVKFAEVLKEKPVKIRMGHIFPNCSSALVVQATLDFGDAILFFAALSFVGLGAQPPAADWGAMLAFARKYMMLSWWTAVFPGIAIFVTVMGFNLLGDSLRDALDPQLRRLKEFKPIRFSWLGIPGLRKAIGK
ncbi:ABC transporter permease [Candidatus Fermentibacteria bacterium]|nr:ABC transporter permease [Candidatus Fermentibacteria bacterium]